MNGFKGYFWNLFKFKSSLLLYEGSGKLKINHVTSHCPAIARLVGLYCGTKLAKLHLTKQSASPDISLSHFATPRSLCRLTISSPH
jgi:hypothetical protein